MAYSFIAVSDVHLGWKLFNLPELAQDLKDVFSKVIDLALEKKVSHFFIVGDLYDTNKPSPDLIKFVSEQIRRLTANGIVVAGIAGDHDKPVNQSSWINISNVVPITEASRTGEFLGLDYNDNSQLNIDAIKELPKKVKAKVEWIFLHGQVPELFTFTEDKKKLDLKSLDPFNEFPKLKGFVLGDIHKPIEGTFEDPTQTSKPIWVGYCGSLGVIKTDEIGSKGGVLYYDGTTISRLKFELDRKFIRIKLGEPTTPINWITTYKNFFKDNQGKKPVFIVEYDKDNEKEFPTIAPLYEIGIVKVTKVRKTDSITEEPINIRSELKTNNRIEATLKKCAQEQEIYDLTLSLLTADDPKQILDAFKKQTLKE